MLKIEYTAQFKKDYKLAVKRNYDIDELVNIINMLANEEKRQVVIHYPSVQKIANESLRSQLEDYFIAYSSQFF